jgi:site-specific recombinase XerD
MDLRFVTFGTCFRARAWGSIGSRMEALTKQELLKLLKVARDKSERDWLMILVSFWHGLRASEICSGWRVRPLKKKEKDALRKARAEFDAAKSQGANTATIQQRIDALHQRYVHLGIRACDVQDGHLTVARAKNSLKTTQALVEHPNPLLSERKALTEFARRAGYYGAPLFPIRRQQFWRIMQRYAKLAGIPAHKAHPHALKHTIAMQMIDQAGIQKTRQRLGHKSISSTGMYLQETDANVDAVIVKAVRLGR